MKQYFAILVTLLMFLLPSSMWGKIQLSWTHPEPLTADSSNFVTASLLVASPSNAFYSNLGHCTLRMECPSFNLDYCFSFETDVSSSDWLRFFAGQANGHIVAVPTTQYLESYQKEGRSVMQYELNLTHHEKQELWRILDQDMVADNNRKYNFLQNNCSSISLFMVEDALQGEEFKYKWPNYMVYDTGYAIRNVTRNASWMQFVSILLIGTEADQHWDNRQRISPESIAPIMTESVIVDSLGHQRPAIIGQPKTLLPLTVKFAPPTVTPFMILGALLAWALLVSLLEWKKRWCGIARATDIVLFVTQTIAGVMLVHLSFVSSLFGTHWNWYLVPLNPLPLLIWLTMRKRKGYYKVHLLYSTILVLFLLATPLSSQLDMVHQLITATLATRCIALYLKGRQEG